MIAFSFQLMCASVNAAAVKADRCPLKPATGPCKAVFTGYYFDPNTQSCLPFTWGGCKGVVPFETKDACKAAKCKEYKTRCLLSPDKGPCKGEKTRYFFDVKTLVRLRHLSYCDTRRARSSSS